MLVQFFIGRRPTQVPILRLDKAIEGYGKGINYFSHAILLPGAPIISDFGEK
jgi:hypothetical protein